MDARRDPRVAALVCREDPVLCAEAYGLELAAGIAVWRVFHVGRDAFRAELCRRLGWRMENRLCFDQEPAGLYPLGAAHSVVVHYAAGSTRGLTSEAEALARLYIEAPPPATGAHIAFIGYASGWAVLASTVDGVESASTGGTISSALVLVYITQGGACGGIHVKTDTVEEAAALAAPLAWRGWRRVFEKVVRAAGRLGVDEVHLHNSGGQVLIATKPRNDIEHVFHARRGALSTGDATAEEVEAAWRGAASAARLLLRALG